MPTCAQLDPNGAAQPSDSHRDSPFFIVGAPRSGTTLLRTMLSTHPRICIPHETEFFMLVPPCSDANDLRQAIRDYSTSTPFRQQELDPHRLDAATSAANRATIFLEMMRLHAARSGKPRIGEKSPHHYRHVEAIAAELPEAKFIHIRRDVRDVAASGMLEAWSCRSAIAQAKSWRDTIREHLRLQGILPADRYCEVRFETLVAEPDRELRRLCDFLGEEFHPQMLRFDERARAAMSRGDAAWSGSTPVALDARAVGRHRTRLTERQLHAVQRIAADEMRQMGYEPIHVPFKASWLAMDAWERAAHILDKFRKSVTKRLPSRETQSKSGGRKQRTPLTVR